MTDDAKGTTALMIPTLEPSTELVAVNVRPPARDHLLAWDAAQRLVAIHEAGHACAAAALGIPVKVIDITNRHGGSTQVGSPFDDTALPWETSGGVAVGVESPEQEPAVQPFAVADRETAVGERVADLAELRL